MENTRHCLLCANQKFELKTGTFCGITNEKPDFNSKCSVFETSEDLEEKIKDANIELRDILKLKPHAIFQTGLIGGISATILIGGFLFGSYLSEKGFFSVVTLIIMGVGFLLFTRAFGPLNTFKSKLAVARKTKDELDGVLGIYGMDYDIDIQVARRYHDITEYDVKLNLKKKHSYQK